MSSACRQQTALLLSCAAIITAGGCSENSPTGQAPPPPPPVTIRVVGTPAGWEGGFSRLEQHELGVDRTTFRSGKGSGYFRTRTTQPPTTPALLYQPLRADPFRGQRIRLSGFIRTSGVTGDALGQGAALWLRADAPGGTRAQDTMAGRSRTGTQDWTLAEIVVDITDDVIGLTIGASLAGPGAAWIDDLKLEVVSKDVPLTAPVLISVPPFIPDSAQLVDWYRRGGFEGLNMDFEVHDLETNTATVDWVRDHSESFLTDNPDAPDGDLNQLHQMIGTSLLIALGEGTHGTRQFFRMKHRVFSWLVRNRGFTQFGIEASLPEALAVDYYVQTGVGDPEELIRGMHFWTWSTEEVAYLVRWMQQWNAGGGQPRVHFTGFDMQFVGVAMDSVHAFARSISSALGDSVRTRYGCLEPYRDGPGKSADQSGYRSLPQAALDACRANIAAVDSMFAQRLAQWSAMAGADRTIITQRLARVVSQWEDNARFGTRDRHMAENVEFWRSRANGTGTMLWAHNAHIARSPFAMGSYLNARYGQEYINFAQTFSTGYFRSIGKYPDGAEYLGIHLATGAWHGSIEAIFDATGLTHAIFDARGIPGGGASAAPLRRLTTMRTLGAGFVTSTPIGNYQFRLDLPEDYDFIIWFRNAGASQMLPTPSSYAMPLHHSTP